MSLTVKKFQRATHSWQKKLRVMSGKPNWADHDFFTILFAAFMCKFWALHVVQKWGWTYRTGPINANQIYLLCRWNLLIFKEHIWLKIATCTLSFLMGIGSSIVPTQRERALLRWPYSLIEKFGFLKSFNIPVLSRLTCTICLNGD